MIKQAEGHIVFSPLDYVFTVETAGGSNLQKYDTLRGEWEPDRSLFPYKLSPKLTVTDPDGVLVGGDLTTSLANVRWTLDFKTSTGGDPVLGTDYTIDKDNKTLTLYCNLSVGGSGTISLEADYVDQRRGDVQKFLWDTAVSCVAAWELNVQLYTECQKKWDLSPLKDRGTFQVTTQLRNGSTDIDDASAVYHWQVKGDGETTWREIDEYEDCWYRGGKDSKAISIEQGYVQKARLRCTAYPVGAPEQVKTVAFLLRRSYGMYNEGIDFLEGRYVFPDTTRARARAVITNRQGNISNPERYFDLKMLYTRNGSYFITVAHGAEGEVPRSMFPSDATMKHTFGAECRELSSVSPLTVDGSLLTADGVPLTVQVPLVESEVTE